MIILKFRRGHTIDFEALRALMRLLMEPLSFTEDEVYDDGERLMYGKEWVFGDYNTLAEVKRHRKHITVTIDERLGEVTAVFKAWHQRRFTQ